MGLLPSFNKCVRLGRSADRARTAIQTAQREGTAIPTREIEPVRRMLEKNSVFESLQNASLEDQSRTLGKLRAYAKALAGLDNKVEFEPGAGTALMSSAEGINGVTLDMGRGPLLKLTDDAGRITDDMDVRRLGFEELPQRR